MVSLSLLLTCAIPTINAYWRYVHPATLSFEAKGKRATTPTTTSPIVRTATSSVATMSHELSDMGANGLTCYTRWTWDQTVEADDVFQRLAARKFCDDFKSQVINNVNGGVTALYRDEELRLYLMSVSWKPACLGDEQKVNSSKCYELLTKTWDCNNEGRGGSWNGEGCLQYEYRFLSIMWVGNSIDENYFLP